MVYVSGHCFKSLLFYSSMLCYSFPMCNSHVYLCETNLNKQANSLNLCPLLSHRLWSVLQFNSRRPCLLQKFFFTLTIDVCPWEQITIFLFCVTLHSRSLKNMFCVRGCLVQKLWAKIYVVTLTFDPCPWG